MPCAGHSPTATCTDTTGWLSVSAQRCRSWTLLTPLAPSSSSFTASNSRPRGVPASTTSHRGHPQPPATAPTWVRAPSGAGGFPRGTRLGFGVTQASPWGQHTWLGWRRGTGGIQVGQGKDRGGELPHGKVLWQMQLQELLCSPCTCSLTPLSLLLTFHEDPEDVSEDGDGGAKDKDREEEGADGVCDLALGLQRAGSL